MSQANVEIVRAYYSEWNSGRFGFEHCTADIEWDASRWAPDQSGVARGEDQVRELFKDFLGMWDELRFEPERFAEKGDRVAVISTVHTRGRNSGVRVADRIAHVFTLRDGLVARVVQHTPAEALQAVGLREE